MELNILQTEKNIITKNKPCFHICAPIITNLLPTTKHLL